MRFPLLLVAVALMAVPHSAPAHAQGIEFGPRDEAPVRSKKPRKPAPIPPAAPLESEQDAAAAVTVPPIRTAPPAQTPAPGRPDAVTPALAPAAAPAIPDAAPEKPLVTPAAVPPVRAPAATDTAALPPPPAPANCKNSGNFNAWLAQFRQEASAKGVSSNTIHNALDGMSLDGGIIARDRKQGIFAISFLEFSAKLATPARVKNGRAQIGRNAATFDRVAQEFGVPASVITGFWALESDFGAGMGKLPILRSLATLAYDCRRGPMFRAELLAALQIIDRGDLTPDDMVGSWAGELGQTQFLPTRYLEHAIDYDGDKRPDVFRSSADIIGSTANYMTHLGWRKGEPWLQEVRVPTELPWQDADLTIKHPLSKWAGWGVTAADGGTLQQDSDLPASLVLPMGRFGPAFLAYANFDIYLKWNQSLNYAITAAYLATRIDGAPPFQQGRKGIPVLDAESSREVQRRLADRGFDVGEIDGKIGLKTRQAIKAMQQKYGLPADSYPTPELLAALRDRQ
ncbi:MAG: lytic murein transglycosylase [Hyphomicrobiaceae bacterium]|jgi:lytic murein transglycosylase|nr:lytic murein transglycosylase [Hyphomicrobiaceae bacterium]